MKTNLAGQTGAGWRVPARAMGRCLDAALVSVRGRVRGPMFAVTVALVLVGLCAPGVWAGVLLADQFRPSGQGCGQAGSGSGQDGSGSGQDGADRA